MHKSYNVTAQTRRTACSKINSLKHHRIIEKHHECFSRHLIFWKMLRRAHSKHSTSRVSNPKLWSLDLHAGQSLTDALWTDSWLFPCFHLHYCVRPYFCAYPGSPQQRGAEGDVALCKSSGYKDLRWSILMILSIAITKRHELDCYELFCQNYFSSSYTSSPGTSEFHGSTSSWQANFVKCYESC